MPKRSTPFTVDHFRGWASQLELDDGGSFQAEPFQLKFLKDLFSGVPEAWLIVPEANGKTTLVAALALYHARFREQAYVPVAASSQEQSLILFRQAEGFARRLDSSEQEFARRPGIREIRCKPTGAVIKAKAADDVPATAKFRRWPCSTSSTGIRASTCTRHGGES